METCLYLITANRPARWRPRPAKRRGQRTPPASRAPGWPCRADPPHRPARLTLDFFFLPPRAPAAGASPSPAVFVCVRVRACVCVCARVCARACVSSARVCRLCLNVCVRWCGAKPSASASGGRQRPNKRFGVQASSVDKETGRKAEREWRRWRKGGWREAGCGGREWREGVE